MWATNLKVAAVVLGTLAFYTLIANSIPQLASEVPRDLTLGADVSPEQLVQAGEQVYTGSGGCTTCHGLGARAPNLLTDDRGAGPIGARCGAPRSLPFGAKLPFVRCHQSSSRDPSRRYLVFVFVTSAKLSVRRYF